MKKKSRLLILLAACLLLCAGSAYAAYDNVYASAATPGARGWLSSGSGWMFLGDGGAVKGWANIGGYWYCFDESGNMMTGWKNVNGHDYYFTETVSDGHPEGSCQNVDENVKEGTDQAAIGPSAAAQAAAEAEAARLAAEAQAAAEAEARAQAEAEAAAQAAAQAAAVNPYGHTCVEVDLTNQLIRVWQGENLVITGPCVTGYKGVHDTSVGNFTIKSKETDRYLQGYNDNGTKYKSYVNFWMPFNGGQGLHDAGWRGTSHENYGGNIYTYNGSHGCVNLPYDVAAALYNIAYVGMPVHTHY